MQIILLTVQLCSTQLLISWQHGSLKTKLPPPEGRGSSVRNFITDMLVIKWVGFAGPAPSGWHPAEAVAASNISA